MIVQVGAHARHVSHDVDAMGAQMIGGADSREHQDLRRFNDAGRDNDLAPDLHLFDRGFRACNAAANVLHTRNAVAVEQQTPDLGMRPDREIRSS